jgi:propionyl-CoA carboxylase alpha chain
VSFSTVLVANRGEIARRIIRAARERGLIAIAIYVEADADAPFVADADHAIRLETSYLDGDAIIAAALRSGAEAIHPGYGFLSENAAFAASVEEAGLVWVGPPSRVIASMGDKLEAKKLALAAGVPVLPSSNDVGGAASVGFPLMIKAAAGGGGKGMRIVADPDELPDAVAAAQREAASGFGDDRVFFERYLARSRHVEIQILGDRHGHLVHLGERECSIQRRHQKLIEESPSPALSEETRRAMGAAALDLARAIGYESAGTVEFLVDDETGDFYFLEVNARLQVEHPVTEEVTGIDLVGEQFRLAQGDELGYEQDDIFTDGHAIEVRLCAEDPTVGFLPAVGTLAAFEATPLPLVRWESGVERGSVVSVSFDPLLAKVIAYAPSREEAASTLARALESLHVGGVKTNRDFLAATLRSSPFLAGETTTDFIERFNPPLSLAISGEELRFAAVAGALWLQGLRRANSSVQPHLPSGWRNARLPTQQTSLRYGEQSLDVHYQSQRDGSFDLGEDGLARVHHWSEEDIDLEVDGRRARSRVTHHGDRLYVQIVRGTVDFLVVPRFDVRRSEATPGGLNAPMPGVILDIRVSAGQRVELGQTLVIMEAMKMEHVISAPHTGTVREVLVTAGQQVDSGTELLALDDE